MRQKAPALNCSCIPRLEISSFDYVYAAKARRHLRVSPKFGLFGHFGDINFGNESTLQAMLHHVRRHQPDADVTCICTDPGAVTKLYGVSAVSMNGMEAKALWLRGNPVLRLVRQVLVALPIELYRCFEALKVLKRVDVLIVPGTGLLTDVCGLRSWGPYNMFKWSVAAKVCGCKLLFVSVGAGPLHSRLGRWLVKSALALADFRSYRDTATKEYLNSIGFAAADDKVYPDLAFSLPEGANPSDGVPVERRSVVGLGLMLYAGRLSLDRPSEAIAAAYLENLVVFVKWLLDHGYDIRLLIGDICDTPVTREFRALLKERLGTYDTDRIIDEPVRSVEKLLAQLNATDVVVATRFHNILLAAVFNKPVISISFHQKCVSLMSSMGLSDYCQDIKQLESDKLIAQFIAVQKDAENLKSLIKRKTEEFRMALDEQYEVIFRDARQGNESSREGRWWRSRWSE